jgi:hypothetical protein
MLGYKEDNGICAQMKKKERKKKSTELNRKYLPRKQKNKLRKNLEKLYFWKKRKLFSFELMLEAKSQKPNHQCQAIINLLWYKCNKSFKTSHQLYLRCFLREKSLGIKDRCCFKCIFYLKVLVTSAFGQKSEFQNTT